MSTPTIEQRVGAQADAIRYLQGPHGESIRYVFTADELRRVLGERDELDAKWRMAEAQCFDQVGKIGELARQRDQWRECARELAVYVPDAIDHLYETGMCLDQARRAEIKAALARFDALAREETK